jgi:hypothetical protein
MITHQPLLSSAIVLLLLSSAAVATEYCPREFDVIERDKKDGYTFEKRMLDKLFCNETFEGEHFKIVYATENEAIKFNNANTALIKKAANAYYHLTIARDFWINEIKSDYVQGLPQITIRLDITNAFSNVRHYKNAEQEKNFNNAWSVPEGETPRFVKDKIKWGKEIWFSPMKKIDSRKHIESKGNNPIHESLLLIKDPIIEFNANAMIYSGLSFIASPTINSSTLLNTTIQRLATVAILYGMVESTKYMDKWFMEKWYYIDTALVPDIIYHEFAHIAMSDTMKTVHSVPVIEGMADYFAARITDRKHVYKKMKKISSNKFKNTESKMLYHPYLEGEWNATSDFTLSLLWAGRLEFEKLNKRREKRGQGPIANYDQIIYQTHLGLTENSDIMNDLTGALLEACNEKCLSKRAGLNTFNIVFEKKGLN